MFFSDLDTDRQPDADTKRQPHCRMMRRRCYCRSDARAYECSDDCLHLLIHLFQL